jgi:hypothetical protein
LHVDQRSMQIMGCSATEPRHNTATVGASRFRRAARRFPGTRGAPPGSWRAVIRRLARPRESAY